jgi:uncharacterized protein with PQ loop repeat
MVKVEEVYLESAKKLRASLPKFVIFLITAFLIWLFASILLIPLGRGIYIGDIETSKIASLITIITILVLLFGSFKEIKSVADASAGFVAYYIGKDEIDDIRLKKLRGSFRSLAYVLLVSILFMLFKSVLEQIHPALPGIGYIVIVIWAFISLAGVVFTMSSEIEEATKTFVEEIERRPRKKQR